jgi:hypothetical protein
LILNGGKGKRIDGRGGLFQGFRPMKLNGLDQQISLTLQGYDEWIWDPAGGEG